MIQYVELILHFQFQQCARNQSVQANWSGYDRTQKLLWSLWNQTWVVSLLPGSLNRTDTNGPVCCNSSVNVDFSTVCCFLTVAGY